MNSFIEPRIHYILNRKEQRKKLGPYQPKSSEMIEKSLQALLEAEGIANPTIENVSRMTGGASKEQFSFNLSCKDWTAPRPYVLRMDPAEGIVETCRLREYQLMKALQGTVPIPPVLAVDAEGDYLGNPGSIAGFVEGVTKPSNHNSTSVSGIGSTYGEFANVLAPQFVEILTKIHNWQDWSDHDISEFVIPKANSREAALYQVDQWSTIWRTDMEEPVPLITLTEHWLRENAPICKEPCLVHCDYRVGNFMFSEANGEITTVLDWELAHFGDFHEDIAWIVQKLFGCVDEAGNFLVCGLMTREDFLAQYQALSGRTIDSTTLHYYEVLNAWKCAVMDLSSAIGAGRRSNSHQDLLITWLGSAGAVFLDQIEKLLLKVS
ncbi:phosphotransferase family protein [Halioxenophilus aromaticivorans]|uniref:Phosphotransferase family protein n=1 Tax=Halioxenophilus aromaticivorans TaxID=1306992 RepID=A0AAV3U4U3_9ALTE